MWTIVSQPVVAVGKCWVIRRRLLLQPWHEQCNILSSPVLSISCVSLPMHFTISATTSTYCLLVFFRHTFSWKEDRKLVSTRARLEQFRRLGPTHFLPHTHTHTQSRTPIGVSIQVPVSLKWRIISDSIGQYRLATEATSRIIFSKPPVRSSKWTAFGSKSRFMVGPAASLRREREREKTVLNWHVKVVFGC